jgi:hypothetical protein
MGFSSAAFWPGNIGTGCVFDHLQNLCLPRPRILLIREVSKSIHIGQIPDLVVVHALNLCLLTPILECSAPTVDLQPKPQLQLCVLFHRLTLRIFIFIYCILRQGRAYEWKRYNTCSSYCEYAYISWFSSFYWFHLQVGA